MVSRASFQRVQNDLGKHYECFFSPGLCWEIHGMDKISGKSKVSWYFLKSPLNLRFRYFWDYWWTERGVLSGSKPVSWVLIHNRHRNSEESYDFLKIWGQAIRLVSFLRRSRNKNNCKKKILNLTHRTVWPFSLGTHCILKLKLQKRILIYRFAPLRILCLNPFFTCQNTQRYFFKSVSVGSHFFNIWI